MAMVYKWVGKCSFILLKEYLLKDIRKGGGGGGGSPKVIAV